ncbi:MAG: hypothetical protein AAB877_01625 [Patescibacteria group bacterium]
MSQLAVTVDTVFGLAFDIEKAPERKSGFKPAQCDLGAKKELFGDVRLAGFAALLMLGFAKKLIVIGGKEGRYKNEEPAIGRAFAICEMLTKDLNVEPACVSHVISEPNTGGNIAVISHRIISDDNLSIYNYAVVSNHYHIPRIKMDLRAGGLPLVPIYPAEAFLLVDQEKSEENKQELIIRFGRGPLAERMVEEIQGIAHKLAGTYQAKSK